jgi:hypothetical protein
MFKFYKIIIFVLAINIFLCLSFVVMAHNAHATNLQNAFDGTSGSNFQKVGSGAGYKTEDGETVFKIVGAAINIVLSILGVVFLFLMMYAGYEWMTARGNEQTLDKAKDTLTRAVIGLIIVASAYAISFFVMSKISTQTLNGGSCGPGQTYSDGVCH